MNADVNVSWNGPLLCVGVILNAELTDNAVSPLKVAFAVNTGVKAPVIVTADG